MAIRQRKHTNVLLTFKVLHFVSQLRRRVKPRVQRGFDDDCRLGTQFSVDQKVLRRASEGLSRLGDREAKQPQHVASRVCKYRKNNLKAFRPALRLLTAQDAINTLSYCRVHYSDDWLVAQGKDFGLDIDEIFIANYEHLLLRLQAELVEAMARKALEKLLQGGHDKRQRRLLSWLTELFEKPRPLGISSFPWTIKPSLAVLWGSDFNFGLELIGSQAQPAAQQQTGDNVTVGPNSDVFEARNADTWSPDWHQVESRHPSLTDAQCRPIGQLAHAAPPQFPGTA
ncbi:hypothetical protein N0V94_003563 [Neodidymelliopsis sp. IMI 364377]|nr:hypothetical protein N0V94_003563 [Neodidymelliopsis sp. IMI 364377]